MTPQAELAWRRAAPTGLEWIERRTVGDAELLLACGRDAKIRVLDARTGRVLLREPELALGGVRPVPGNSLTPSGNTATAPRIIYCHDRYSVYGIAIARGATVGRTTAALRWRTGDVPHQPPAAQQGDPEFLSRIVAAHATDDGVLVLRNDGRLALLRAGDGQAAWTLDLEPLSVATIYVSGDAAAIVWKAGNEAVAAFLDLTVPVVSKPERHRIGSSWPIWTGMSRKWLVAVWPDEVVCCDADGARRARDLQSGAPVTAAAIELYVSRESRANPDASEAAALPGLVYGDARGRVRALDLASGKVRWQVTPAARRGGPWTMLQRDDDLLLLARRDTWAVLEAPTGSVTSVFQNMPEWRVGGRMFGATLRDGALYGIRDATQPTSRQTTAPEAGGRRELVIVRIDAGTNGRGRETVVASLGADRGATHAFWLDDRVVLVEPDGVRAFIIP